MKRLRPLPVAVWLGVAFLAGLAHGYTMIPPTISAAKEMVIDAKDTLSITCRGQWPLVWSWPGGMEDLQTSDKEKDPEVFLNTVNNWTAREEECDGIPTKPYCKVFTLTGAQANDTGYYRCNYKFVVAKIEGTTSISTYVFVRDWEQPFINSPGTLLVSRKDSTRIPCLVSIPDLNVTLHMGYSVIPPDGKTVTWDNKKGMLVPTELIQNYLFIDCQTTINKKVFQSNIFIIHVTGNNVYDIELYPKTSVQLLAGEKLHLNCTVWAEFNTGVTFEWDYPGKQNQRPVEIIYDRRPQEQLIELSGVLVVDNVTLADLGKYVCTANNGMQRFQESTEVFVHEKPFINIDQQDELVVEATAGDKIARLPVKFAAYPPPKFQWFKDGKAIANNGKHRHLDQLLQIRDVSELDAGKYTLDLENEQAGLRERVSIHLIVNASTLSSGVAVGVDDVVTDLPHWQSAQEPGSGVDAELEIALKTRGLRKKWPSFGTIGPSFSNVPSQQATREPSNSFPREFTMPPAAGTGTLPRALRWLLGSLEASPPSPAPGYANFVSSSWNRIHSYTPRGNKLPWKKALSAPTLDTVSSDFTTRSSDVLEITVSSLLDLPNAANPTLTIVEGETFP